MNNKDCRVFLAFEGLSGSGKTTVAKLVAESIGATFYKTPPAPFDSIRNKVDRESDISARFHFYLASIVQASYEISKILKEKSVVCDRYILTTLCYHQAIGVEINLPKLFFEKLLQPDHTFLVVCEDVVRLRRLQKRGMSYNDIQERKPGIEQLFLAGYRRYPVTEIDNSGDGPEIATKKVINLLRG